MENQVINEIQPLIYSGKKVLSTPQLAVIFQCNRQNITVNFRNNRNLFVEGEDFFFLKGKEFKAFRQKLIMESAGEIFAAQSIIPPFSHGATNTYLWTESGVEKLSKIISTDNAKFIYSQLRLKYFQGKLAANKSVSPQIISQNLFSPREKYDELKYLIEKATDENLRDRLIKSAAQFLLAENIDGAADNLF